MRKEILHVSLKQFLKHGIRRMSVQKLVQPLNISTKTVYKYFENKEDLIKQSLHLYYDQKFESLKSSAERLPVIPLLCDLWHGALKSELNINQAFFHDLIYYYPELSEKFTSVSENRFVQFYIQIIKRGMAEGFVLHDIHPEAILDCMSILYTATVRKRQLKNFNLAPLDLLRNTMIVYIRGICTPNGITALDRHIHKSLSVKSVAPSHEKLTHNISNVN